MTYDVINNCQIFVIDNSNLVLLVKYLICLELARTGLQEIIWLSKHLNHYLYMKNKIWLRTLCVIDKVASKNIRSQFCWRLQMGKLEIFTKFYVHSTITMTKLLQAYHDNNKQTKNTLFHYILRETDKLYVEWGIYPWKLSLLGICRLGIGNIYMGNRTFFLYFLCNINYFNSNWYSINLSFWYPLFEQK